MERPPLKGLLDIALPMLHELSDDTQQSSHLVVPSEQLMVVIARIDPPADLGLVVRIGHRRPILEGRSEEHTSELQSLMPISYAVFCLKINNKITDKHVKHTILHI